MNRGLRRRVERALGTGIAQSFPMSGGNIADAYRVITAESAVYAVKWMLPREQPTSLPKATLKDEAYMLAQLGKTGMIPVPSVVHVERDLLILSYVPNDEGSPAATAQGALADTVAALHNVTSPRFGFDRPTPIGPLQRPNDWSSNWVSFLRDNRLMFLGRLAAGSARLPSGCFSRLEALCANLDQWIPTDRTPTLIHGDLWIGNILFKNRKVAGLIDPACYFADSEIELAFLTLFGGVGDAFFERYGEHHSLDPLFFEERRALYQLEPLLAHAWFFGGGYGARVDEILHRYVR